MAEPTLRTFAEETGPRVSPAAPTPGLLSMLDSAGNMGLDHRSVEIPNFRQPPSRAGTNHSLQAAQLVSLVFQNLTVKAVVRPAVGQQCTRPLPCPPHTYRCPHSESARFQGRSKPLLDNISGTILEGTQNFIGPSVRLSPSAPTTRPQLPSLLTSSHGSPFVPAPNTTCITHTLPMSSTSEYSWRPAAGFYAIMGPSGSGKTTLLNTLAHRLDRGTSVAAGEMRLNGRPYSGAHLKLCSGYVMQDDLLNVHLSVKETLMYTAELRLPAAYTAAERLERVTNVLVQVGDRRRAWSSQVCRWRMSYSVIADGSRQAWPGFALSVWN